MKLNLPLFFVCLLALTIVGCSSNSTPSNSPSNLSNSPQKLLNSPDGMDALILSLQDKDPEVRCRAVSQLGRIGNLQALESIFIAAEDEDSHVRENVIRALENALKSMDDRRLEVLIRLAKDKNSQVRQSALRTLAKINSPQALEAIVLALKDEDSSVQYVADCALRETVNLKMAIAQLLVEEENPQVRAYASDTLEHMGGDLRVIYFLYECLQDKNFKIRRNAAWAMRALRYPLYMAYAVNSLIEVALYDEDPSVQEAAIQAFGGGFENEKEVSETTVFHAIRATNSKVLENALKILIATNNYNAIIDLGLVLKNTKIPLYGRINAAWMIGELMLSEKIKRGDIWPGTYDEVMAALSAASQDQDPALRTTAEEALKKIKSFKKEE